MQWSLMFVVALAFQIVPAVFSDNSDFAPDGLKAVFPPLEVCLPIVLAIATVALIVTSSRIESQTSEYQEINFNAPPCHHKLWLNQAMLSRQAEDGCLIL